MSEGTAGEARIAGAGVQLRKVHRVGPGETALPPGWAALNTEETNALRPLT